MTHTVAIAHIVGAIIAGAMILVTISLLTALRGGKKDKKPLIHPYQQATRRRGGRRIVVMAHRLIAGLFWAAISPVGWLVGNRTRGVWSGSCRAGGA